MVKDCECDRGTVQGEEKSSWMSKGDTALEDSGVTLDSVYKVALGFIAFVLFTVMGGEVIFVVLIIVSILLLGLFGFGIVRLIRSGGDRKAKKNKSLCICSIILPVMIWISIAFFITTYKHLVKWVMIRDFPDTHYLGLLWRELSEYAGMNEGRYPDPAKWCDILKEQEDVEPYFFNGEEEGIGVGLNKNISLIQGDVPDDIVLLYESEQGWNLSGDFQEAGKGEDNEFAAVKYVNGEKGIYRKKHLRYLKWKPGDTGVIPQYDYTVRMVIFASLVATGFIFTIFLCRTAGKKIWGLAILIGVLSAGAGAFFGGFAEDDLYRFNEYLQISGKIGGLVGLGIGVAFFLLIAKIKLLRYREGSVIGPATVIGGITGITASCIVHGFLMIAYGEPSFYFMAAGQSFGLWAGIVLGWITSGMVRWCDVGKRVIEIEEGVSDVL